MRTKPSLEQIRRHLRQICEKALLDLKRAYKNLTDAYSEGDYGDGEVLLFAELRKLLQLEGDIIATARSVAFDVKYRREDLEQLVDIISEIDQPARAAKVTSEAIYTAMYTHIEQRGSLRELALKHWKIVECLNSVPENAVTALVCRFRDRLVEILRQFDCLFDVFCCYAREDKEELNMLAGTSENKLPPRVRLWWDKQTSEAEDYDVVIKKKLLNLDLVVLLISQEWLRRDYVRTIELPHLLDRRNRKSVVILPVVLERCDWMQELGWLSKKLAMPEYPETVSDLYPCPENRRAFFENEVCKKIGDLMQQITGRFINLDGPLFAYEPEQGAAVGNPFSRASKREGRLPQTEASRRAAAPARSARPRRSGA